MCADPASIAARQPLSPLASVSVTGPNAVEFLQGYVTCDLEHLSPKTAMPLALPDLHGRVIANGWAMGDRNEIALLIHPSLADAFCVHLEKYMVFSRCKFGEMRGLNISLSDSNIGPTLAPLPCYPVNELTAPSSQLFNRICVQLGVVLVQIETTKQFLPQMIGLVDWGSVSFTKGCYLGQEVISRAQYRGQVKRTLKRFEVLAGNAFVGQTLKDEEGRKAVVVLCCSAVAWVVVSGNPMLLRSGNTELSRSAAMRDGL